MWSGMLHTGWMVISSSVLPFISKLLMRFRIYLTEFERIQIAICCHLVQFVYLQLSPPITLLPPSLLLSFSSSWQSNWTRGALLSLRRLETPSPSSLLRHWDQLQGGNVYTIFVYFEITIIIWEIFPSRFIKIHWITAIPWMNELIHKNRQNIGLEASITFEV